MLSILLINTVVISLAVIIHYEALNRLSLWLPKLTIPKRYRIAIGIFGALVAHVIEVWLFGVAYYLKLKSGEFGSLVGQSKSILSEIDLLSCVYFSFTTYSSLGYGDIVPIGHIRYLAGLEALTGLVLIAWTASFMYYEMQRDWK